MGTPDYYVILSGMILYCLQGKNMYKYVSGTVTEGIIVARHRQVLLCTGLSNLGFDTIVRNELVNSTWFLVILFKEPVS